MRPKVAPRTSLSSSASRDLGRPLLLNKCLCTRCRDSRQHQHHHMSLRIRCCIWCCPGTDCRKSKSLLHHKAFCRPPRAYRKAVRGSVRPACLWLLILLLETLYDVSSSSSIDRFSQELRSAITMWSHPRAIISRSRTIHIDINDMMLGPKAA
jgi:hypothetical protein